MRPSAFSRGLDENMLDIGYAELKAYIEGSPRTMLISGIATSGSTENGQELGQRMASGFGRDASTVNATRGRLRARSVNRELNVLWHASAMSILGDVQ